MKRFILLLTGAMTLTGAAFADSVTVNIPSNVKTADGAAAYTSSLEKAVTKVCRKAFSPLIGINVYGYRACLKNTRADVSEQDPTGLYASRFSKQPTSLALAAK